MVPVIILEMENNTLLEVLLYKWIRKSDGNIPLTGDIVRQKALECVGIFYPHKKDKFRASNHWLHNFFERYGIKSFRTSGETKSVDREAEKRRSLQCQRFVRLSKIISLAKFITWMRLA